MKAFDGKIGGDQQAYIHFRHDYIFGRHGRTVAAVGSFVAMSLININSHEHNLATDIILAASTSSSGGAETTTKQRI